ncbi:MAG: hypothetical protein LBE51_08860 [Acidovorax sp.]|jgi:hypothetical protein|nr:hypothetical protein [Acidovorax sp.]
MQQAAPSTAHAALAPFAQVEALVNTGVQSVLANAVATWQGCEPFGVIFARGQHEAFGEVATGAIVCSLPLVCVPGLAQGDELVVDGVPYEVAAPVQPDASGWAALQLRKLGGGARHG